LAGSTDTALPRDLRTIFACASTSKPVHLICALRRACKDVIHDSYCVRLYGRSYIGLNYQNSAILDSGCQVYFLGTQSTYPVLARFPSRQPQPFRMLPALWVCGIRWLFQELSKMHGMNGDRYPKATFLIGVWPTGRKQRCTYTHVAWKLPKIWSTTYF
jgi:hypothetical protein